MIPKAVCRRVTFTLALFLTSTVMLNSHETANTFLLTVFLRHDQTKNVNEINEIVGKNGFRDKFPPQGIEVVSWYVMMGIGQVVTLRVPPARLREVNLAIEQGAWGATPGMMGKLTLGNLWSKQTASEMRLAPLLPLSVLLLRARIGHSKHLSTETVQSCLTRGI